MLAPVPHGGVVSSRSLIDAVAGDAVVTDQIVKAVLAAEVDAINDSGPFRRKSHRGTRAEEQSLQHLGVNLQGQGFEWEEVTNQIRFVAASRYRHPLRLVYCRGGRRQDGLTFRISGKGERTIELINENQQGSLFHYLDSTINTHGNPVSEMVYNLWIIADARKADLSIYLAYPTRLERDWRTSGERFHTNLKCTEVRSLWYGSLGETAAPVIDRPEAVSIEGPSLVDRESESASG